MDFLELLVSLLLIVLILFVIVIYVYVAIKFEKIAEMKGHTGYFWWCFWMAPVGWLMVIALPDRNIKFPECRFQGQTASDISQQSLADSDFSETGDRLPNL